MVLKRTLLTILIFFTLLFISYQLWLVINPLRLASNEKKYVSLVDQYQLLKIERMVMEEKCALQQTKAKFAQLAGKNAMNLANFTLDSTYFQARRPLLPKSQLAINQSSTQKEPVALSLQETKTFEQLEAYVSNSKPLDLQPLTRDEKTLLLHDSDSFTLQLMGVREATELTRFVTDNHLQDAHIFHTYYLNKDWYVLVSGSYKNHTEALKAIETLPKEIKELKPWIRQLSSVQKAIQLYR
jgi:hypothetical protein